MPQMIGHLQRAFCGAGRKSWPCHPRVRHVNLEAASAAGDTYPTMPEITEHTISCPYCGEPISILVDDSVPEQNYVEDCQVCCRPIVLDVATGIDGDIVVGARAENE
jgi:hypothetical protein